ncbi:hypothetical protein D9M73_276100 [compost metagenome]
MRTHDGFLIAFDHHPHQRLGTRLAQQHATTPGHLLGHPRAGLLHLRVRHRILTTTEAHVDQHLRALAQGVARLGQTLLATAQGQ